MVVFRVLFFFLTQVNVLYAQDTNLTPNFLPLIPKKLPLHSSRKRKKSTLQTLRYKYLVIPAQMGSDGRKMVLRLGIELKAFREKIRWILNKIETYFNERSKCIAFDSR